MIAIGVAVLVVTVALLGTRRRRPPVKKVESAWMVAALDGRSKKGLRP